MYLTLFGTPSGFSARTYGRPPFEVDDRWIDSRNEVPLDDGEWAALVSRRQCAQGLLTWIGLYRPAHEIHVSRGGQYGAGLWLLNHAAPGPEAFALLTAVADEVARLALANGKFTRTIDAFEPEIRWPDALGAAVRKALRPATQAGVGTGDKPMLLMDASAPDDTAACGVLIDLAQGGAGLGSYQRMLITTLPRVARQAMASSHATVTTPAKWQQGVEAVVDAAAQRTREELQAALADAESVRRDMAAMRERLLADHDQAMAAQSARLTAEFGQQLQQANVKLSELEAALQRAGLDLVAARNNTRKAEEAIARLERLVDDYQADASVGFNHADAAELALYAELLQELESQLAATQDSLASSDMKLKSLEQDNQSLRGRLNAANRQINEDAERHQREVGSTRRALEADMVALRAAKETASSELDIARQKIEALQSNDEGQREQLRVLQSRFLASHSSETGPPAMSDLDWTQDTRAPRATLNDPWALRASPMAVAMAVVLLIAGVSVVWGLSGNKTSPQASVTTPAASQAAAVSGPDCAAAWLAGAVTTSPAISAPTNLHPAAMADAVWMAACNVRRESACRDHDLRELTRRLDSISPPPNTSRWTLKVGLPLGCQLAADSTWEWSSGGLVAQRAYLPAADKKEAASVPAGHDKPAKPGAGKSALAKAEVPKAGTAKAEPAKAPAAGAAATARAPAAGGSPAPSAPKADAKPPAGDRPATVSTPGAPGAAGGGAGDVVP